MPASSRLTWAVVYIVLLAVSAYAVGLPDLRCTMRSAVAGAAVSTALAAGGMSLVQLVLGSLLLPRFVIFSSALVLIPWYAICASAATDGRDRDEGRDRILAALGPAEAATLEVEL